MNYRTGIVTERDAATCRVRVSLLGYDMATQMLPVISQGAAADKFFSLPNVGDTVALIMDDRCEDGAVIGCLYNEQDTPPGGSSADTTMVRFSDGNLVKYDKAAGKLTIKVGNNEQTISASGFTIKNQTDTLLVILSAVLDALAAHIHPTPAGPSGPPTNAAVYITQKTKLQGLFEG